MEAIPEFLAAGVDNVQGGTFPARIWGAFMENVGLESGVADWPPPPPSPRDPARLYLPGTECLYQVVGYTPAATVPEDAPPGVNPDSGEPSGFAPPVAHPQAPPPTDAPSSEEPPAEEPPAEEPPAEPPPTGPPATEVPTTTAAPTPVYAPVPGGTTIPPDVLDPNAPVPSAPANAVVLPCR
jgi:hypothetical protein